MSRPKRGVRFSHKSGNASGSEGRRSSFSDVSEDGSPSRSKPQLKLETVDEVCHTSYLYHPDYALPPFVAIARSRKTFR